MKWIREHLSKLCLVISSQRTNKCPSLGTRQCFWNLIRRRRQPPPLGNCWSADAAVASSKTPSTVSSSHYSIRNKKNTRNYGRRSQRPLTDKNVNKPHWQTQIVCGSDCKGSLRARPSVRFWGARGSASLCCCCRCCRSSSSSCLNQRQQLPAARHRACESMGKYAFGNVVRAGKIVRVAVAAALKWNRAHEFERSSGGRPLDPKQRALFGQQQQEQLCTRMVVERQNVVSCAKTVLCDSQTCASAKHVWEFVSVLLRTSRCTFLTHFAQKYWRRAATAVAAAAAPQFARAALPSWHRGHCR